MLMEVGVIAAGVPLGYVLRKHQKLVVGTDKAITWIVRLLLFLMGISIGGNELLMAQLNTLGVRAVVISLCSVAGSLVAAWWVGRLLPQMGEQQSIHAKVGALPTPQADEQ